MAGGHDKCRQAPPASRSRCAMSRRATCASGDGCARLSRRPARARACTAALPRRSVSRGRTSQPSRGRANQSLDVIVRLAGALGLSSISTCGRRSSSAIGASGMRSTPLLRVRRPPISVGRMGNGPRGRDRGRALARMDRHPRIRSAHRDTDHHRDQDRHRRCRRDRTTGRLVRAARSSIGPGPRLATSPDRDLAARALE